VPWPTTSSPSMSTAAWPGRRRAPDRATRARGGRGGPPRVAGDGPRERLGVVAELDAVTRAPSRCRTAPRTDTLVRRSASRGPTTTRLVAASFSSTYSGRGRRHAEPAALADREAVVAAVSSERAPTAVDDLAGPRPDPAVAGEERRGSVPARKHRSWESGLPATASPASAASSRTRGLSRSPRGKRRRSSEAATARRACSSGPCPDRRRSGAAGRRRRRPRARSGRSPARRRPAARRARSSRRAARGRCSARTGSGSGRPRDRRGTATRRRRGTPRAGRASGGAAHLVGQRASAAHGRGRTARALGVVVAVGPQLEGHADGLAPGARTAARPPRCPLRRSWRRACDRAWAPVSRRRERRRRGSGAAHPPRAPRA
jgi:hypothetical protein